MESTDYDENVPDGGGDDGDSDRSYDLQLSQNTQTKCTSKEEKKTIEKEGKKIIFPFGLSSDKIGLEAF